MFAPVFSRFMSSPGFFVSWFRQVSAAGSDYLQTTAGVNLHCRDESFFVNMFLQTN